MFSKFNTLVILFIIFSLTLEAKDGYPDVPYVEKVNVNTQDLATISSDIHLSVIGQGVAPSFSTSPAQSYALAKRAATADAYRLIAEKIKGVKIAGKDTIENMMVKNSVIESKVSAMIKNANIVNVTFKDGLCEVEMEIDIDTTIF